MRRFAARSALNVAVTSLAVVMAGSGDVRLFERFKTLQSKLSLETTFGTHMATGMAIGFLFLGKGTLTLSNSNVAVAGLLCSLFPTFPKSASDHRAHLQALRHLWVLAIDRRCAVARDVSTRQPVIVPIRVELAADPHNPSLLPPPSLEMMSPCTLPDLMMIKSIHVRGPRYWPVAVDFVGHNLDTRRAILENLWVKRKSGHRPYLEDPEGHSSILAHRVLDSRGLDQDDSGSPGIPENLVRAFSADPQILAFVEHFCNNKASDPAEQRMAEFCTRTLLECIMGDKPEAIQLFIWLHETTTRLEQGTATPLAVWNLVLAVAQARARRRAALDAAVNAHATNRDAATSTNAMERSPLNLSEIEHRLRRERASNASSLVPMEFIDGIVTRIDSLFNRGEENVPQQEQATPYRLVAAYLRGETINSDMAPQLGACLIAKRIPDPERVANIRQVMISQSSLASGSTDVLVLLARMFDPLFPHDLLRLMAQDVAGSTH
nr:Anaphase-promoting complex subunit 1 [Polyrhizophydium stewartii]